MGANLCRHPRLQMLADLLLAVGVVGGTSTVVAFFITIDNWRVVNFVFWGWRKLYPNLSDGIADLVVFGRRAVACTSGERLVKKHVINPPCSLQNNYTRIRCFMVAWHGVLMGTIPSSEGPSTHGVRY